MRNSSTICVSVVEKDEIVLSRINNLLRKTCSVIQHSQIKDVVASIREGNQVDMLIINEASVDLELLNELHDIVSPRFIPILLLCDLLTDKSVKAAIKVRATDVLPVGGGKLNFDRKILFFSELATSISNQPDITPNFSSAFFFRLPVWKRGLDIMVSLGALLALSPLLVLVAIFIKLDSKGPVFYRSKRVGSNFHIFDMIKFRTMTTKADQMMKQMAEHNIYTNATATIEVQVDEENPLCNTCQTVGSSCQRLLFDQNQFICEHQYIHSNENTATFLKFRNDPRITRLGGFLRNSSIDELPQLLNILFGDMSLVGNRPLPVYEAEKLTINESVKRFAGPSGLTGLWQVEKRARGEAIMDDKERISLDIEYVETFSFKKDMNIIGKTFFSLWQKENV